MYRFASAYEMETTVFGAARPGYKRDRVMQWISFMQERKINRVCCLLSASHLSRYSNLLDTYRGKFGDSRVCWTPIDDFQLVERSTLIKIILPFLIDTQQNQERVVIHCSGGVGRTGQILAAWLVAQRSFSNRDAIATVLRTGRNPYEAVIAGIFKGHLPWITVQKFHVLLDDCRATFCLN